MARSEAQKKADKKYRESHKGDFIKWSTVFPPEEAKSIDEVIKQSGMNKAEFIRWAVEELKKKSK